MKLGLVENGRLERFPYVCSHCGHTYWYQPGGLLGDDAAPPMPDECKVALGAELAVGKWKENEGRQFWTALHADGYTQGITATRAREPSEN